MRIISNNSHDVFVNSFAGGVFLATLAAQPKKLLLVTHEAKAPEEIFVETAWKFAYPFKNNPGILELDSRITQFSNPASGAITAITKSDLTQNLINGKDVFNQKIKVFKIEKKQGEEAEIKIPISDSDKVHGYTHFSFRYAKFFDIYDKRKRDSEPLKNYELSLFSGTNQIGRTITGSKIKSIIQRVYPTRKISELETGYGCADVTRVILQTTEVRFKQFFERGSHTIADLARIDAISIVLNAAPGKKGPDTFCLVDFICTFRNL